MTRAMLYPLVFELADRRALVVGLGRVGNRRASALVAAGARVLIVDPAADPAAVPPGATILAEPYRPSHLDGVDLAFAAASPEVNRRVVADARSRGVWVNSASAPRS